MKKLKYSIRSFRLRTLPLSVAGIILGSMLAAGDGFFNTPVFCLAIFTTLCLQILSNISNDLGDALKEEKLVDGTQGEYGLYIEEYEFI